MADEESKRGVPTKGKLIDSLRKQKGWTIEDFAADCGLGMRTVQKALAGLRVSIDSLQRIADSLAVEYASLLLVDTPPSTTTGSQSSNAIIIHEETDGSVTVK